MKLEDKLTKFREMGLKAEIKNGEVKLLTQRDVFRAQKEKIKNEKRIEKLTEDRTRLQADLDSKVWENSKARTKAQEKVIKNEEEIAQLRLDNEEIDKKTGTTADTGFSGNDQGLTDDQIGVYEHRDDILALNCGDVALLKGETWDSNENGGLVHRSPRLTGGDRRLLLTLDFGS